MNIDEEKRARISEIQVQLKHLDNILPYHSEFRQDYNELKNQPLALLSNEQLRVIGSKVANLQDTMRKNRVQP